MNPSDEPELTRAFCQGERAAFDTLFARYAGRVFAFAHRLSGCRSDAEELTQETFVAAFRSAPAFRGDARLLTWLLGIALRRFRDTRRGAPRPVLVELDGHEPSPKNVENEALAGIALHRALARLDVPLREAFLLVAAQGLTHREAANVLGAPVGTIKWRVAEATRRLRVLLSEDDAEESSPHVLQVRKR